MVRVVFFSVVLLSVTVKSYWKTVVMLSTVAVEARVVVVSGVEVTVTLTVCVEVKVVVDEGTGDTEWLPSLVEHFRDVGGGDAAEARETSAAERITSNLNIIAFCILFNERQGCLRERVGAGAGEVELLCRRDEKRDISTRDAASSACC